MISAPKLQTFDESKAVPHLDQMPRLSGRDS